MLKSGCDVETVIFPEGETLSANEKHRLVYEADYHGDHDECWVIDYDRESGNELCRHNTKYIVTIIWKPKDKNDA